MDVTTIVNLFLNKEGSDIDLQLQASQDNAKIRFPGHSFIFKRASTVFKTMLESGKFKEGSTRVVRLKVKGNTCDAINFVRYLYTKDIGEVDLRSCISLMQTSHLYDVKFLFEMCEKKIGNLLSPSSVCNVYDTLSLLGSDTVINMCHDIMLKFAFLIFDNNLHISLNEETMKIILASDNLNVIDETQALGGLWNWGRVNSILVNHDATDIKDCIANLLHLIRWSHINDLDSDAPWAEMVKEMTSDANNLNHSHRIASDIISYTRFSEVLKFSDYVQDVNKKDLFKYRYLTEFSISKDIILTGFAMRIDTQNFVKRPIKIYVNFRKVLCSFKEVSLFDSSDFEDHDRFRRIVVEFRSPVLLLKLRQNIVHYHEDILQPAYSQAMFKSSIPYKPIGSKVEVNWDVLNTITYMEELYFFLRK